LRKVWQAADAWLVGRYVIMPDHIHYFAAATETSIEFENWVRYWKSQFSKQHGAPDLRWQAGHWDTRMRSARAFEDKWNYVRENPVRKGLVRDVDEWPFQGEVFDWRWE
jgi:putative transposase